MLPLEPSSATTTRVYRLIVVPLPIEIRVPVALPDATLKVDRSVNEASTFAVECRSVTFHVPAPAEADELKTWTYHPPPAVDAAVPSWTVPVAAVVNVVFVYIDRRLSPVPS